MQFWNIIQQVILKHLIILTYGNNYNYYLNAQSNLMPICRPSLGFEVKYRKRCLHRDVIKRCLISIASPLASLGWVWTSISLRCVLLIITPVYIKHAHGETIWEHRLKSIGKERGEWLHRWGDEISVVERVSTIKRKTDGFSIDNS